MFARQTTPLAARLVALGLIVALPAAIGCGRDEEPTSRSAIRTAPVTGQGSPTVIPASSITTVPVTPAANRLVTFEEAEAAYHARRYPEAVQLFEAYSGRKDSNPWGHYMLGLSAWKAGQSDRAIGAFERTLELSPTHRKALLNLSRVLIEAGRSADAVPHIDRVIALDSASGEGYRLLGRARNELGDLDGAVVAYRESLTRDPEDVWSLNNLGLVYLRQGLPDIAVTALARAVEVRSDLAVVQNNLGIALEQTGHVQAAAEAFERALAIDSGYDKATVSLARVRAHTDRPGVAPVDLNELAREFVAGLELQPVHPVPAPVPAGPDAVPTTAGGYDEPEQGR